MLLISSGMPSSRPTWAVIADIVIMSMYSRIIGPTPLATIRGIACGHRVERRERREHRRGVRRARVEPQRRLGDERERALGPDDQLGEVVAGGRLHELAAGADDLAGRQHGLEAEHLVAGDAVLHRPHAAGVGGDVAAEAGAVLARDTRGRRARAARAPRRAARA